MKNKNIASSLILSVIVQGSYAGNEKEHDVLETVTVTTTAHAQNSAPASVTVITGKELQEGNVTSIIDIIKNKVGVDTLATSGGREQYNVRGMLGKDKHTLILVDGKRVSSSNALWRGGNFDNTPVPLAKIERVEVVRGPMSTLYGSDAIGGVVNIITKMPNDSFSGNVEIGGKRSHDLDGGDGHHLSANLSIPIIENVSASVTAATSDFSEWNNGKLNAKAILEPKSTKNLGVNLDWQLSDKQSLEFNLDYSQDSRDKHIYRFFRNTPLYREQEAKRTRLGITHTADWSWGDSTLFANYEKTKIGDFNDAYPLFPALRSPALHNISEKNIHLKGYANIDNLSNQVITVGAEYFKTDVTDKSSYVKTGKGGDKNAAVFVQDEIGISDTLNLTLGGRYDRHDVFGGHFSPKAYAAFQANDNIIIKGGISSAFKAPGIYQLNKDYKMVSCGGRCTISGEPTLKPETTTTSELGVWLNYDNWHANATAFHTKAKDLIEPHFSNNQRKWENINSVKINGVELEGGIDLTDQLTLSGNYTYLDVKDESGNRLPYRNKHQAFAKANYTLNDTISGFVSVAHASDKLVNKRTRTGAVLVEYPNVTTLNVGAKVNYKDVQINLGVDNVGNVKLHEKELNQFSAPGRVYYTNMRYDF